MLGTCSQGDSLDSNLTNAFTILEHKNPKSEQFRNAVPQMCMLQSCDGVGQDSS